MTFFVFPALMGLGIGVMIGVVIRIGVDQQTYRRGYDRGVYETLRDDKLTELRAAHNARCSQASLQTGRAIGGDP